MTMRPEIETVLADYEAERRAHAKEVLAALAPLALDCDEIEAVADRIAKLDKRALYWVMRRLAGQLSERLAKAEAARSR